MASSQCGWPYTLSRSKKVSFLMGIDFGRFGIGKNVGDSESSTYCKFKVLGRSLVCLAKWATCGPALHPSQHLCNPSPRKTKGGQHNVTAEPPGAKAPQAQGGQHNNSSCHRLPTGNVGHPLTAPNLRSSKNTVAKNPTRPLLNNGGGGVWGGSNEKAPTHFLARGTALGLPLWGGGGGVNLRRHPPTKPPRPHEGKYKEKNFPAPLAPGIYRDMGQRRPTSDLPLPRGGGGSRLKEAPNFFKKAPPPPQGRQTTTQRPEPDNPMIKAFHERPSSHGWNQRVAT